LDNILAKPQIQTGLKHVLEWYFDSSRLSSTTKINVSSLFIDFFRVTNKWCIFLIMSQVLWGSATFVM